MEKMNYDLLLDAVLTRSSERKSIRQAAFKVGIADASLGRFIRWRETGEFPSNTTLFKLAEIAHFDKVKSHFALMAAKTKEPELSMAYDRLAEGLDANSDR